MDYKHTRQDRRIQKEMASTRTKNATKPNPSTTTADRKEEDQLDDLKNVGESSYNPGDRTDQRVKSLVFMMMTFWNTLSVPSS